MTTETAAQAQTRSSRLRWWALVVVCLAMFMNALDSSIVNVALPDIQRDLHFSQSGLTWVVDAFLITFGSFLLLAGRLGDLIGRKKIFLAGSGAVHRIIGCLRGVRQPGACSSPVGSPRESAAPFPPRSSSPLWSPSSPRRVSGPRP